MRKLIVLASESQVKRSALMLAQTKSLANMWSTNEMVLVPNMPEQPVGMQETFHGAWKRAEFLTKKHNGNIIAVGIESGIFPLRTLSDEVEDNAYDVLDIGVIVVMSPGKPAIVVNTVGVLFPGRYVRKAMEKGFATTTVASVITEELGGNKSDPHFTLSGGKISRVTLLSDALRLAFQQV